jgi:hypothetical protein
VARQNCGATGYNEKHPRGFVALMRGNIPVVSNGSLSRATICGTTNTAVEKGPETALFSANCKVIKFREELVVYRSSQSVVAPCG